MTDEAGKHERLKKGFFFLLLAVITALVITVARPFLMPLLLAAISAGLAYPIKQRLFRKKEPHRNIPALLTLIIFCLIIIFPTALLGYFVTDSLISLATDISKNAIDLKEIFTELEEAFKALPFLQNPRISQVLSFDRFADLIQQTGSSLLENLADFAGSTARSFLMIFIYLYCLYFFIRDGESIMAGLGRSVPLAEGDKTAIIEKFLSVTRATLKSTLVIGLIQGTIGGFLFFVLGIKAPVLWGTAFLILAAIPGMGPVLIWLPATAILLILGTWGKALVMLLVGAAVIPLADYILRPRIVGQDTQLHPVLVFIGVFGGVVVFGIWGLLFGPLVMSLAVTVLGIFTRLFRGELDKIQG
ncbi:MAG: AI-2E family transporter [Spirochaetales bacterium]|nr:AI-2E family transporter [Spirochaetales bacterium]